MAQDWLEQGRVKQKRRTRRALIDAAVELTRDGGTPTVAEAAERADVSRATAYRYFPTQEALTIEAAIEFIMPCLDDLLGDIQVPQTGGGDADGLDRLAKVERALADVFWQGETQVRTMLKSSMELWLASKKGRNITLRRQGRRMPMIDAAIAPLKDRVHAETYQKLRAALAIVLGMESMIALTDVIGISDPGRAGDIRRWAMQALVRAALAEASQADSGKRETLSAAGPAPV